MEDDDVHALSAAAKELKDARENARRAIELAKPNRRSVVIVAETVRVLRNWNAADLGPWADAIVIVAWRKRWKFDPGAKGSDLGALRLLVRYLFDQPGKPLPLNRCSQYAAASHQLRDRNPGAIPDLIAKAGGIDRLSFRGGKLPRKTFKVRLRRKTAG